MKEKLVPIAMNENGLFSYIKAMDEDTQLDYLDKVYGIKIKRYISNNDIYAIAHWVSLGYGVKVKRQNYASTVFIVENNGRFDEFKISTSPEINIKSYMKSMDYLIEQKNQIDKLKAEGKLI